VLRVNFAQPNKIKGGDKGWATQAVWADADDWCACGQLLLGNCWLNEGGACLHACGLSAVL
jgi:hypothetical protein